MTTNKTSITLTNFKQKKEEIVQNLNKLAIFVKENQKINFDELTQIQTFIKNYLKKHQENSSDSTSIMQTPQKNKINKIAAYSYAMSQIKTTEEYQQLSQQNDLLTKQLEQIMENYQRQKITLSNQAQNILSIWLQSHSTPQPPMIELFKDIIQELAKHMSVQQYINSIQSLQSHQTINQMSRVQANNASLIFKQAKKYVIQMAKILHQQNQQDQDNQNEIINFNNIKFQ